VNVLILGASGFIGTSLTLRLLGLNFNVSIYLRPGSPDKERYFAELGCKVILGDFSVEENFERLFQDVDICFNLIKTVTAVDDFGDLRSPILSETLPTISFLKAWANSPNTRLIYASSGGTVYGQDSIVPVNESALTVPISAYGINKVTIESYIRFFAHNFNLNYIVLRISNPYGLNQSPSGRQGVVPIFIKKIIEHGQVQVFGDGKAVRDYLHIDDLVDALISSAIVPSVTGTINIGTGVPTSLLELIRLIEGVIGKRADIQFKSKRTNDCRYSVLDISSAHTKLGWRPNITLRAGVETLAAEIEKNIKARK